MLYLLCKNATSSSYKEKNCSKILPYCVTIAVEHIEEYLKKKVCFSEPALANVGVVTGGEAGAQLGQIIPDNKHASI